MFPQGKIMVKFFKPKNKKNFYEFSKIETYLPSPIQKVIKIHQFFKVLF
jgi:hypothetical protein